MTKRSTLGLMGLAATSALIFGAALPASANDGNPAADGKVATTSFTDQSCLEQIRASGIVGADTSVCDVTGGISVGEEEKVTLDDIDAIAGLSASDKAEMKQAAGTQAISSKHWSQFTTGGVYTRTHNGRMYYNGSRVWVTQTVSGYTGSHACFTNVVAPGWEVIGGACNESGGTASRSLYSQWNVRQFPLPVVTNASMTAVVYKNGTISGFGATVG